MYTYTHIPLGYTQYNLRGRYIQHPLTLLSFTHATAPHGYDSSFHSEVITGGKPAHFSVYCPCGAWTFPRPRSVYTRPEVYDVSKANGRPPCSNRRVGHGLSASPRPRSSTLPACTTAHCPVIGASINHFAQSIAARLLRRRLGMHCRGRCELKEGMGVVCTGGGGVVRRGDGVLVNWGRGNLFGQGNVDFCCGKNLPRTSRMGRMSSCWSILTVIYMFS